MSDQEAARQGFDRIRDPRAESRQRSGVRARQVLLSGSDRRRPAFVCASCSVATPIGVGSILRVALPIALVVPWRAEPVFAICPSCRRRTWLAVRNARFPEPF